MKTYLRLTIDGPIPASDAIEAAMMTLEYYKANPPIPEHTDRVHIRNDRTGATVGTLTIATSERG